MYYNRWPLILKENLIPSHTLSGNKTISTASRDGIKRTYLVILYLQNVLGFHSSLESVVPFIPIRKLFPFFCRISGNSQKLSNRTYRSLIVNFAPKKEINVESRFRNLFPSRSKLWFHVGRVLQKLRFLNKFLYPCTEFYLNMTKNRIE
jgi:hypothetical protein